MSSPTASAPEQAPADATEAILVKSVDISKTHTPVLGYDFNKGINYDELFQSFVNHGFQASHFGRAVEQVKQMLNWRLSDEPISENDWGDDLKEDVRAATKCTIFLGFTSNMVSCGNREIIRYLCEHKLIDAIVTTCGAIEEDIMKCSHPHYMGDFSLKGRDMRLKGLNRLGNLIVPNENYCDFEKFLTPILDEMLKEQKENGEVWSPSKMIKKFGEKIDNPESVWYWCAKNDIPVFCPAITDGSVGDMIYFHSFKNPGLVVDLVQDIRLINDLALHAKKTGMIILGGGVIKHHICNANLMRNGADYSVFINTGSDFDGSDSGAKPDEAVSWGKIKLDAKPVKVVGDASLLFPLLVSQTFAKYVQNNKTHV